MIRWIIGLVAFLLAQSSVYPVHAAPVPDGLIGYDVSYLDCDTVLPEGFGFAIINVNHGRPFTGNPCFANQVAWALNGASNRDEALAFYVNTSNPGPDASAHWPNRDTQAPQLCDGSWTAACAYDFGWLAGGDAFLRAASVVGTDDAHLRRWWLDVETDNSWSAEQGTNVAALRGLIANLRANGVMRIGIYATRAHWAEITGATSPASAVNAPFLAMPNWIPRLGALDDAGEHCTVAQSLTGGAVTLVQYEFFLDKNYACPSAREVD